MRKAVVCVIFNDAATTEIYTLSLHDALPISSSTASRSAACSGAAARFRSSCSPRARRSSIGSRASRWAPTTRSEEHTPELQSRQYLVCRLLLEKRERTSHLTPHRCSERTTHC